MTLEEARDIVSDWEMIDIEQGEVLQWQYVILNAYGLSDIDVFGDPITEESPYEPLSELDFGLAYGKMEDHQERIVYVTGGEATCQKST